MLSITTYQEALRAIGAMLDRGEGPREGESVSVASMVLPSVHVAEQRADGRVSLTVNQQERVIEAAELETIVSASRASRGTPGHGCGGPISDVLRAAGLALDELAAREVALHLVPNALSISFCEQDAEIRHELRYEDAELHALRRAAADRRAGAPMRRILILHQNPGASTHIRELLVAEFAVEAVTPVYAPAVAVAGHQPELVIAHVANDDVMQEMLGAIGTLRSSPLSARLPIIVILGEGASRDSTLAFGAGASDVIQEPYAPAQLRARARTWLLRSLKSQSELTTS